MAKQSETGISYCDETWSPAVGCSPVSAGCDHCWAERAARLHYNDKFPNGWDGHVELFHDRIEQPLHWKKTRRIAVGFMGDIFHSGMDVEFIDKIFAAMALCPHHTFIVATKRPETMCRYILVRCEEHGREAARRINPLMRSFYLPTGRSFPACIFKWPLPNVILCVSVENQKTADERIPWLLKTPAAFHGVSAEPLLGPIYFKNVPGFNVIGLDLSNWWIVTAGESGPGARPSHPDWFRSLRDQCINARVKFHFKGYGDWLPFSQCRNQAQREAVSRTTISGKQTYFGECIVNGPNGLMTGITPKMRPEQINMVGKKIAGRLLDGVEWQEFPEVDHGSQS